MKTVATNVDQACESYILITPVEGEACNIIAGLQEKLASKFTKEALWLPNSNQVHITLTHIISPEYEYGEAKGVIFKKIEEDVVRTARHIITEKSEETIVFDEVEVFPKAIIIKGHDNGLLASLRKEFVEALELPKETRRPPKIIHITLARFRKSIDFESVQEFAATLQVNFSLELSKIELIRERRVFAQEYDVLEKFYLKGMHMNTEGVK